MTSPATEPTPAAVEGAEPFAAEADALVSSWPPPSPEVVDKVAAIVRCADGAADSA